MKFGLKEQTIEKIIECFKKNKKIERVKIYGSRAMGNFKTRSDIDFAVWGDNLTTSDIASLQGTLEDLPTLYKFDLLDYNAIAHENLKSHIDRVGLDVFVRGKSDDT